MPITDIARRMMVPLPFPGARRSASRVAAGQAGSRLSGRYHAIALAGSRRVGPVI
jgi:hypothetical protein